MNNRAVVKTRKIVAAERWRRVLVNGARQKESEVLDRLLKIPMVEYYDISQLALRSRYVFLSEWCLCGARSTRHTENEVGQQTINN